MGEFSKEQVRGVSYFSANGKLGSVITIGAFGEQYAWLSTVIVTTAVIIFGETSM